METKEKIKEVKDSFQLLLAKENLEGRISVLKTLLANNRLLRGSQGEMRLFLCNAVGTFQKEMDDILARLKVLQDEIKSEGADHD